MMRTYSPTNRTLAYGCAISFALVNGVASVILHYLFGEAWITEIVLIPGAILVPVFLYRAYRR